MIISRTYTPIETKGRLLILEGEKLLLSIKCLELPDKGNSVGISCIPEGTYDVVKFTSPSKGKCFSVLSVPGRSAILIHKGNYAVGKKVDTQGCILPGLYFTDINKDGLIDVAGSTESMKLLLNLLPDNFKLYIL